MSFQWRPNPQLLDRLRDAVAEGLDDAAEVVYDESQRQVPVDKGDLRDSGEIRSDGDLRRRIVYTDPVAVLVHENLSANHDRGNAKYLEQPMSEKRRDALDAIGSRVRRELGR